MNSQKSLDSIASNTTIHVFKYRWVVLSLYVLVSFISCMQLLQFSIISNIVTKYYNVGSFSVDLSSLIFYITYIFFFYPICFLIEKYSIRFTMITIIVLTLAGNLIKLLAAKPDRYWVVMVAQTVIGISQIFMGNIPSKLATAWFGSHEVSTACAIGVLGIQLGVALGCIQSPYLVKNDSTDKMESQFFNMFLYQVIATSVILVLVLVFFRSKPRLPPSQSQLNLLANEDQRTTSYFKNMKKVCRKTNVWIVIFSLGLANSVWNAIGMLLNNIYLNYFPNGENDTGLIGLISVFVGGCLGSMIFGMILDKTHHFKWASTVLVAFSALSFIGVAFSLIEKSRIGTFISIPVLGFFSVPTVITGFEFLVELTYPMPEAYSAAIYNNAICILTCILTFSFEGLFDAIGYLWTFVVTFIIFASCVIVIFFVKADLRRRDANIVNINSGNIQNKSVVSSSANEC